MSDILRHMVGSVWLIDISISVCDHCILLIIIVSLFDSNICISFFSFLRISINFSVTALYKLMKVRSYFCVNVHVCTCTCTWYVGVTIMWIETCSIIP